MFLGHLPIWKGVQDRPGFKTLPFKLLLEKGLIRLSLEAPERSSIVDRYSSPSYSFITTPPGFSEWGTTLGDGFFKELSENYGSLEGKSVLEIGSGSLYIAKRVLKELKAFHFVACDPVLTSGENTHSLEIVSDYFHYSRFKDYHFDLIISLNNLEHIPDPFQYLMDVRSLLEKTGGDFFIVLPDCSRGFATGDWGICLHEHLNYFTLSSFVSLVQSLGFRVKYLKTEGDKIIALLAPKSPQVEERSGRDVKLLENFRRRCFENLENAKGLFLSLKQERGKFGIHGCSAGLNNILALLKLQEDADIFLFDGDVAKVGKYLPTFNKKIIDSRAPIYKTAGSIIIAATTFYSAIRSFAMNQQGLVPDNIYSLMPLL